MLNEANDKLDRSIRKMRDDQLLKFFEFAIGSKVMCNGYLGVVIKMHTGQLSGMADVRLASGDACVDLAELSTFLTEKSL